jgi:hypothetical protein
MKSSLVILTLLLSANWLTSCNQQQATPNPVVPVPATALTTATAKAVGSWQLVSILSGWTGQSSLPTQNVELAIDDQLLAIYYEEGKEVSRYRYQLKETTSGIRYSVVDQIGKPKFYMQLDGNFRVNDQNLTIGDTGVDGSDYTFKRK